MPRLLIQSAFICLTVISYALLYSEIRKSVTISSWLEIRKTKFLRTLALGLTTWALFVSAWSISGSMGNFQVFPFNVMPVLAVPMIAVLAFTFSKAGKEILLLVPVENIIRLQSFRFFVELLLWALYLDYSIPIQMTFEGRNFDVLSGITAPVVAYLFLKGKISKLSLVFWNIACLGLLVNIVATSILSMPSPLRFFMNEPSSSLVAIFPFSLLPGLLVPLAYGLHFLSLRQLSIRN